MNRGFKDIKLICLLTILIFCVFLFGCSEDKAKTKPASEKQSTTEKTDNDDFYEFSKESLLSYGYKIINETYDLHNSDITDSPKTEYEEKFSDVSLRLVFLFLGQGSEKFK